MELQSDATWSKEVILFISWRNWKALRYVLGVQRWRVLAINKTFTATEERMPAEKH